MTSEQLTESSIKKGLDEAYSDGDVRPESDSNGIFTFSYGEYVKMVEGIDYKVLMKRAEDLTAFHVKLLRKSKSFAKLNILKREWFYATGPDIAVIHIYAQL